MLVAAAKHPAMLTYLDNAVSRQARTQRELRPRAARAAHRRRRRRLPRGDIRRSAWSHRLSHRRRVRRVPTTARSATTTGRVEVLGFSDANGSTSAARRSARGLPDLPRPPPHDRPADRHQAGRPLRRRQPPASLVDKLAEVYLDNDTGSRRCCEALFTVGRVRGVDRAEGQAAVRGHRLDRCASSASSPPAPDTDGWLDGLVWMATRRRQAPMGWPARRLPRRRRAWAGAGGTRSAAGTAHLRPAAGGRRPDHGDQVAYPALRLAPALDAPRRTHGALVDALAPRLLLGSRCRRPPRRDLHLPRQDRRDPAFARPTPPLGWRLPYVVALCSTRPSSPPGDGCRP